MGTWYLAALKAFAKWSGCYFGLALDCFCAPLAVVVLRRPSCGSLSSERSQVSALPDCIIQQSALAGVIRSFVLLIWTEVLMQMYPVRHHNLSKQEADVWLEWFWVFCWSFLEGVSAQSREQWECFSYRQSCVCLWLAVSALVIRTNHLTALCACAAGKIMLQFTSRVCFVSERIIIFVSSLCFPTIPVARLEYRCVVFLCECLF